MVIQSSLNSKTAVSIQKTNCIQFLKEIFSSTVNNWYCYNGLESEFTPRVLRMNNQQIKQECIPVGCVPSTTVAVCFGGSPPSQSRHPPRAGTRLQIVSFHERVHEIYWNWNAKASFDVQCKYILRWGSKLFPSFLNVLALSASYFVKVFWFCPSIDHRKN